MTTTTPDANYLDPAAVAAAVGLKSVATVYTYKTKGILPDPDGPTFGITPTWLPETIAAFKASRPGRGKGGGRKPKAATT